MIVINDLETLEAGIEKVTAQSIRQRRSRREHQRVVLKKKKS